jgi:CBS domain-containing protein
MSVTVQDLMTPYPVVVDADTPIAQCARLMDDRDIGALGVTREGALVGVLTDRDIVLRGVAREQDPRTTTAGDLATADVVSVARDVPVEEAEQLMSDRAVRRLFVVAEEGHALGILTMDDLIALREPHSIAARQIREWGIVRSDQGYTRNE